MNQAPLPNTWFKKKSFWALVLVLAAIFFCTLPIVLLVRQIDAGAKRAVTVADSGFRRATNIINPEDLRAWALELIKSQASEKRAADSVPDYVRNLYDEPPHILVDESCVTLIWGGGFFHWLFYIGNTNETMPFISDNRQYPYNFEWKPGIYYTRETKLELQ